MMNDDKDVFLVDGIFFMYYEMFEYSLWFRFVIPNISWKQESRKQEPEKLMQDQDTLRSSILQWCYASYGRCY